MRDTVDGNNSSTDFPAPFVVINYIVRIAMTVDSGYYEGARRGINDQYAAQMAANTYSQELSQHPWQPCAVGDADRVQARRCLGSRRSSVSAASVVASATPGVMQQSMGNYLGDYTRQYGQAQNDLNEQMRQFQLNASQLWCAAPLRRWPISSLDRNREIAFAAQNIAALRSLLGGV